MQKNNIFVMIFLINHNQNEFYEIILYKTNQFRIIKYSILISSEESLEILIINY